MKKVSIFGAILASCVVGESMAACTDPAVPDLTALIAGNTVCAMLGTDKWQEQHRVGGELWDYKLGPTSTTDPTERVGDWMIIPGRGTDIVRYQYGSGRYYYTVHGNGVVGVGNPHSFCGTLNNDGVDIDGAILIAGTTGGCP